MFKKYLIFRFVMFTFPSNVTKSAIGLLVSLFTFKLKQMFLLTICFVFFQLAQQLGSGKIEMPTAATDKFLPDGDVRIICIMDQLLRVMKAEEGNIVGN
ncbi:MAG TPA: hypothetical protein EYO76_01440 [Flavobacteriaceae bacterium]|nr:hypothetical protein [Flavobacteriaceae bacterium]